jgi:hypothetical protein
VQIGVTRPILHFELNRLGCGCGPADVGCYLRRSDDQAIRSIGVLYEILRVPARVAAEVLEQMLWLNPADNQGARGLLPAVRAGEPWQADG